jgi:hypothetical protein
MEKVHLDEGLWYIENFLTKKELNILKKYCDEPTGWYTTMRSHYKNILNKFPMSVPEYEDNGDLKFPDENSVMIKEVFDIFNDNGGIFQRLESVLPEGYGRNSGIQTFKYCTDEEIKQNRDERFAINLSENQNPNAEVVPDDDIDYAMNWHWEDSGHTKNRTASHSIYLNDDFDGGYVEFIKGYVIKPKAGMLLNIPIGKEFEHRVTKVLGPNSRHTLYGQCWSNALIPFSTKDDC